jgi:hypothetical protein
MLTSDKGYKERRKDNHVPCSTQVQVFSTYRAANRACYEPHVRSVFSQMILFDTGNFSSDAHYCPITPNKWDDTKLDAFYMNVHV